MNDAVSAGLIAPTTSRNEIILIKDRYQLLEQIGSGSWSTVYRGLDHVSGAEVAIKRIDLFAIGDQIQRIRDEIEFLQTLDHPNIVKLYDSVFNEDDEIAYIILEYCKYGDLYKYLKKMCLKEKFARRYTQQIAAALKCLRDHGILHRDLKPHNILLADKETVKLADFGFARYYEGEEMVNTICGTPIYMAPEIAKMGKYNNQSDLWSVGVMLYQMLVGKLPFIARTQMELLAKIENEPVSVPDDGKISDEGRDLLYSLLQADPVERLTWKEFFEHPWICGEVFESTMPIQDVSFPGLSTLISAPPTPVSVSLSNAPTVQSPLTEYLNMRSSSPIDIPSPERSQNSHRYPEEYPDGFPGESIGYYVYREPDPIVSDEYVWVDPPSDEERMGSVMDTSLVQSVVSYIGTSYKGLQSLSSYIW